jgi:hypothetical protein
VFGWNAGLLALGTTCAGNKRAGVVLVKVRHVLRSPAACGAEALALFCPHAGIMTDRCCRQQANGGSMRMPAADMCQYPPRTARGYASARGYAEAGGSNRAAGVPPAIALTTFSATLRTFRFRWRDAPASLLNASV